MDKSIMQISFLHDSFMNIDSNDHDSDPLDNKLNFSTLLSDASSSSNSSTSSNKKRKRSNYMNNNHNDKNKRDKLPPNKKQRVLSSESSPSLNAIDENCTFNEELQHQKDTETKTVNKNDKKTNNIKKKKSSQRPIQPLRRSQRLKDKQKLINSTPSTESDESASNESLTSISIPLSALKLKKNSIIKPKRDDNNNNNNSNKMEIEQETDDNNTRNRNCRVRVKSPSVSVDNDWSHILSESVCSKWNAKATPIKSSLKINKRKQRMRKVNWGNIECRNYEQRCGIYSCAVPTENGPSLHLGRLLSQTTLQIDQYESDKNILNKSGCHELPKKERIQRVQQFSSNDINKKKLKEDTEEIKSLKKSRNVIGCKCLSIYKMKKNQIIERILYLNHDNISDKKQEKKILNKKKKNQVFDILIKLQFDKYGRYDVCCIDDSCYCFKNGIECQIDSDCCKCGGDVIYNNYLKNDMNDMNDMNDTIIKKQKMDKKDSLCCGNPNGNTLNVSVMDYIDNNYNIKDEHEIIKTVQSSFLAFTSPAVQKTIVDWNKHYNLNDYKQDKEDKENHETVQRVLNFD